ncbi:MAG: hypothetical protein VX603_07205 [Gemmatimonadota bacterium]|nr:hypothetical protein [Gemmatimonadota bacterium]
MLLNRILQTSVLMGLVTIMALPLSAQELFDTEKMQSDTEKVLKDFILTKPETDTKRFKEMKRVMFPDPTTFPIVS